MSSHYQEFSKRWKISRMEKKSFERFKASIMNILNEKLDYLWSYKLDKTFCEEAHFRKFDSQTYGKRPALGSIETAILKTKDKEDLFFYLEVLLRIIYRIGQSESEEEVLKQEEDEEDLEDYDDFDIESLNPKSAREAHQKIIVELKKLLDNIPLGISLSDVNGEMIFYPTGAKLLDEALINDVLDWLINYPKAYNSFKSALEKYEYRKYKRNLLDDLRNSLELFLKKYLKSEKSLENQKEAIFELLKEKKTSSEIRNMFWLLLDKYSKYQNNYVKHDDDVNEEEIEFMIYLTGTFIRFFITLDKKV